MAAATQRLLDDLGERSFSPRSRVGDLSVAQQQVVEVVEARSLDARILVMDEPTAALADEEVDQLLALVGRLRDRGLAVLYISHRLREVFAVADRITVLKDGRRVDTLATAETSAGQLVAKMVGREIDGYVPPRAEPAELGDVRLAVRGGGNAFLAGIDLEVRAGEIVGIAGLQGAGRTELARAIFGSDPFTAGSVEIDGAERRLRSPRDGIAAGLGFLTEDRKSEGLALARRPSRGGHRADARHYHLNIEEQDPAAEIRLAGAAGRVAHVQVCANDRGAPGADHMDWRAIRDALVDVGYDGPLCIESFTAENESIATAASISRPLARSQDATATDGLAFLRSLWV